MLKSKIQSMVGKSENPEGFEVITDKRAAHVVGGACDYLKKCGTYTGSCDQLEMCSTFDPTEQ